MLAKSRAIVATGTAVSCFNVHVHIVRMLWETIARPRSFSSETLQAQLSNGLGQTNCSCRTIVHVGCLSHPAHLYLQLVLSVCVCVRTLVTETEAACARSRMYFDL